MDTTAKLSTFVVFILVGARVFSLTFYGVNGHVWVEHLLPSLPGGQLGFLIVVNLLIFVLAFFLDFFELSFIIIPLVGPVADKLGIDLIWFGVLLGVNMQTSFMHPPFGFALFYLRSVAPAKDYLDRVTGKLTAGHHHRADLLGRGAVRADPGRDDRAGHRASRRWCSSTRRREGVRHQQDPDHRPGAATAVPARHRPREGSRAAPPGHAEQDAAERALERRLGGGRRRRRHRRRTGAAPGTTTEPARSRTAATRTTWSARGASREGAGRTGGTEDTAARVAGAAG